MRTDDLLDPGLDLCGIVFFIFRLDRHDDRLRRVRVKELQDILDDRREPDLFRERIRGGPAFPEIVKKNELVPLQTDANIKIAAADEELVTDRQILIAEKIGRIAESGSARMRARYVDAGDRSSVIDRTHPVREGSVALRRCVGSESSFHLGWRSDSTAPVPIWKIDAENGEIVWQTDFECHSEEGVSGGIQSTVAVGKYDFSDYVYVTVAKTNDYYTGQLVCLRKDSGEIVWEQTDTYTWSSPVCVYNRDGSGAVLYFTFGGDALLIDGLTGEEKCRYSLGEQNIEASPAVYENYVVVGSRSCNLFGFRLD